MPLCAPNGPHSPIIQVSSRLERSYETKGSQNRDVANLSDVAAVAALIISAGALWHSVATERRRSTLETQHRELEQKLIAAQLDDRDAARQAVAREIFVRSVNLSLRLGEIRDRRHTRDGLRGVALWTRPEVDQLLQLAGRFDNTASRLAAEAADSLTVIHSMIDPLLRPQNVRSRIPPPLDPQQLSAAVTDAHSALLRLRGHVEPTVGSFALEE